MGIRHEDLWRALDTLAAEHGLTPSGLARAAGLDATSFNRSKRRGADGRLRWPSTESLSRALTATGASLESFSALVAGARAVSHGRRERDGRLRITRVRGLGCLPGRFDRDGLPDGRAWEHRDVPSGASSGDYALSIETSDLAPALCPGDLVMVSPDQPVDPGDRVVVCLAADEIAPAMLDGRGDGSVDLVMLAGDGRPRHLPLAALRWMHRITWIGR